MREDFQAGQYLRLAGEFIAVSVAAIYLAGYLVLRSEITILGIPTGVDAFDHRYIFTGASYLLYVLQAALILIPAGAALVLLLVLLGRLAKLPANRGWRSGSVFTESRVQITALQIASMVIVAVSAWGMKGWIGPANLLLNENSSASVTSLLASADPEMEVFKIYLNHLFALIAAVTLLAVSVRRSRNLSALATSAMIAIAVHSVALTVLYGSLNVIKQRPRIVLEDGSKGLLVWEDDESYVLVPDSTQALTRRLKSAVNKVEFSGLGRLDFARRLTNNQQQQPGGNGK